MLDGAMLLKAIANTVFDDASRARLRVGVIGRTADGDCLSLLRAPTQKFPLTWGTPGGKVDPGETPLQAAIREFTEETGGTVANMDLICFDPQDQLTFVTFVGHCRTAFTPVLDHEHTAFAWTRPEQWPQPPSPGMARILADRQLMRQLRYRP